jgi:ribonuclease P protein component
MKKAFRVCKNYEFSSIIQNRQFVKSSSFVLYFRKRNEEHSRIGISVGKKLGNAVCRNKVKRQVRSIVDQVFTFEEPYDLIIIVRPNYKTKSFNENLLEMKENQNRVNKRFLKSRG